MNNKTGLHDLIFDIARGSRRARDELDPVVRSKLNEYLRGQFGSSFSLEDIEEIASQAILTMLVHAGKYRGEQTEKSAWEWAYTIARNQALKWQKTVIKEVSFPRDGDDTSNLDGYQIYQILLRNHLDVRIVESQVDERLLVERLIEIVENLDPREKQIVYDHFVKGLSLKRIAANLNISAPRVTQIVKTILQKCHRQLVMAGFDSL